MAKKPLGDMPPEVTAVVEAVKTAATNAANKIVSLKDQLKTNPTPAELDQLKTDLQGVADGLNAAAAD